MDNTRQQYWWGANEAELDLEDASRQEEAEPVMPWREAYELNKTRDTCILCGKRTIKRQLYSSVINFCSCIDKWASMDK